MRAKTMISYAQGGTRGVWGSKVAVQGPLIDPSDGPIADLIERDTFVWTLFGIWGCSTTATGQNLGCQCLSIYTAGMPKQPSNIPGRPFSLRDRIN